MEFQGWYKPVKAISHKSDDLCSRPRFNFHHFFIGLKCWNCLMRIYQLLSHQHYYGCLSLKPRDKNWDLNWHNLCAQRFHFSLGLHFRHIQCVKLLRLKLECSTYFVALALIFSEESSLQCVGMCMYYSILNLHCVWGETQVNCVKLAVILPFHNFIHYHMVGTEHDEESLQFDMLLFFLPMCCCIMGRNTTAHYVLL